MCFRAGPVLHMQRNKMERKISEACLRKLNDRNWTVLKYDLNKLGRVIDETKPTEDCRTNEKEEKLYLTIRVKYIISLRIVV